MSFSILLLLLSSLSLSSSCFLPIINSSNVTIPSDPLTGDGNVDLEISVPFDELIDDNYYLDTSPLPDYFFQLPSNAAPPSNIFSGRLVISDVTYNYDWKLVRDDFGYEEDGERFYLPPINHTFIQSGSFLIPLTRGLTQISPSIHPYWDIIINVGRCWDQNGDYILSRTSKNGIDATITSNNNNTSAAHMVQLTRCSIPFALNQRNSNCLHNGYYQFVFGNSNSEATTGLTEFITYARYQITQETCMYFKSDFWGQLPATYIQSTIENGEDIISQYALEKSQFLTYQSFDQLENDFPSLNSSVFASAINDLDISTYGLISPNGASYRQNCVTRYDYYPFPDQFILPSYSTAKSLFAGLSAMAISEEFGSDVYHILVPDYLPDEVNEGSSDWDDVTMKDCLDMVAGNFNNDGYMEDESNIQMTNFFLAMSYEEKIRPTMSWRTHQPPKTTWVYQSSATFLSVRMMQVFLERTLNNNHHHHGGGGSGGGVSESAVSDETDIFDYFVSRILKPLNISSSSHTSLRTLNDEVRQSFGGYGLFWEIDDIVKLVHFIRNMGVIDGKQILDRDALFSVMQLNSNDRGYNTTSTFETTVYQYGWWAKRFTPFDNPTYECTFWVPYWSGYGGIRVVLIPNGWTYYYFSDNGDFTFEAEVLELYKLSSMCHY